MNIQKTLRLAFLSLGLGLLFGSQVAFAADSELELFGRDFEQTITCDDKDAWHTHTYENTTDLPGSLNSYMIAHKFRMYLHDDFMSSIDLNSLQCSTPRGYIPCNGGRLNNSTSSSIEDYGGITARLVRNDRSSTAVLPNYVEWTYGVDDSSGKPMVSGVNPGEEDLGKIIGETIIFEFKGETVSSATTTAALYVQFWAYDRSCGGFSDMDCWTPSREDGSLDKHWNNHTFEATTHYEPCEEQEVICRDLEWTSPGLYGGTNMFNVNELYKGVSSAITATATDTRGNDITEDVEYHYEAFAFNGARSTGVYRFGALPRGNNVTTAENVVNFSNSKPGDRLKVEVVGAEEDCSAELLFPYCADLNLEPSGTVQTDGTEDLRVTASATTGQAWPFDYSYDSTDANDTFNGQTGPLRTNSEAVAFATDAATGEVSALAIDDVAGLCEDQFIFVQEDVICEDLALEDPELPDGTPVDTNNNAQMEEIFRDEDTLCFDFSVETSGPTFEGILQAVARNDAGAFQGSLNLNVTGLRTGTGNPAEVRLDGNTDTYRGVLCWQDFSEDGDIELKVIGSPACEDDFSLGHLPPEAPVCVDLQLDPNKLTIDRDEDETGRERLEVDVEGSASDWDGQLIIESNGSCDLEYADGSDGENGGKRLNFPVDGTRDSVIAYSDNCEEDDDIVAYISGERSVCEDELTVDKEPDGPNGDVCEDLTFNPDELDEDLGDDVEVEIDLETENDEEDIVVTYYCPEDDEDGVIEYDGDEYDGEVTIRDVEDGDTVEVTFLDLCEDAEIEAFAEDSERTCSDELSIEAKNDRPGEVNESIFTFNFNVENDAFADENVFFTHDEDRSFFTIEYDPNGSEETLVFRSDLWEDGLDGHLGTGLDSSGSVRLARTFEELTQGSNGDQYRYATIQALGFGNKQEVGTEAIRTEMLNNRQGENFLPYAVYIKPQSGNPYLIPSCEDEEEELCYDPDDSPANSEDPRVVVRNADELESGDKVRVRTVGVIVSGLNCDDANDACLTEEFTDESRVQVYPSGEEVDSRARLVSLCSYLLTRNAGDIYLEVDLQTGSDVSCIFVDEDEATSGRYRNSDALIILQNPADDTSGLGYSSSFSGDTVSLCDDDEFSDNLIGNLSSYVCEVISSVQGVIAKSSVQSNTDERLSQATRNVDTDQGVQTTFNDWNTLYRSLHNKNNPNSGILYFKGNGANSTITLGNIVVPEGAWTLVVEDAKLVLGQNIKYNASINFGNLPSMAFVVQGGDIFVRKAARELVGVYYTDQKFDGDPRSAVDDPLEIIGSVYGNIQTLINQAKYVGSPQVDGGGLTIRYDNRILLNTPPALSEYVDINTREAVN